MFPELPIRLPPWGVIQIYYRHFRKKSQYLMRIIFSVSRQAGRKGPCLPAKLLFLWETEQKPITSLCGCRLLQLVTETCLGIKRAGDGVIAINPPLLTTHTFPPVELDYDIIRPKRVVRQTVQASRY